jgi:hypothetical protein
VASVDLKAPECPTAIMRVQCLPFLLSLPFPAAANFIPVPPPTSGHFIGELLSPDVLDAGLGFLDCAKGDNVARDLCNAVLAHVHALLAAANLRIDRSNLLFTYDDPNPIKIPTGHACSVTASILHTHVQAQLLAPLSLNLSGKLLSASDPALLVAEIPVRVKAKLDVRQCFGQMLLGNCLPLGRDTYTADGDLLTTASVAVLFSFGPTLLKRNSQEDWVFIIRPMVKAAIQLTRTDVELNDVRGMSFLTGLVTAILGGVSSLLKGATSMLLGEGLSKAWAEIRRMLTDVVVGVTMTFPGSLYREMVEELALAYVEEKKGVVESRYSAEMDKKLRELVSRALGLDANGERTFVIPRDFVNLLRKFGTKANIFEEDGPGEKMEL